MKRAGTTLKMFWQPLPAPSSVGTKTNLHTIQNRQIEKTTRVKIPQFLSWEVTQGLLESIIKANSEGKITIFASQNYSKKVRDRMNSLLLKRKEFREDEVRKTWKSYIKFPGVLMVKKPTNEKYKVFDCDS